MDDVADGAFDAASGGISITLQRLRRVGFSRATSHGGKVVVAPCARAAALASNASTPLPAEWVVVVNPGGTNEAFVQETWPTATRLLVAQGAQYDALLAGDATLTVTDQEEARLFTARHAGALCEGGTLLTANAKALLLPRPADVRWRDYVDAWIVQREARGADAAGAAIEQWLVRLARFNVSADACDGATRVPIDRAGSS